MEHLVRALERAEFDAFWDLYAAVRPDVAARSGLRQHDLGFARLGVAQSVDVLALNRAIGVGLTTGLTTEQAGALVSAIAQSGAPRVFVPVAPVPGARETMAALEARGLRRYNNWMRLQRSLDAVPDDRPDAPEVRPIDSDERDTFSDVVAQAFQYPPAIAPLAGQTAGRPAWRHYLAVDRGVPIGAGAMYIADEAAWIGFGATLSTHRGRGAQTALIIRRLRDARAAGCRWVSVETAEPAPTRDVPSLRNLTRLGFETIYRRPNYLWTRDSS